MAERPPDDLLNDPWLRGAPVIEGFKVLEPAVLYAKVGQGGMGAVYRGRHFKLDLDVAVKCLKPSLVDEAPDFVKRFQREARLAASITHQNVVHVMDVHEKHGIHYLVMEFVRGETARERVKRKGRLGEAEALAIVLGATTGLAEAHGRGIVHRDIKPDNVMISTEGRVKLADLGLAKASHGVDEHSLSMGPTGIMGTPQFMPPEQWDTSDVGPAADVWALGATLWYLLAGRSALPSPKALAPGAPTLKALAALEKVIQQQEFPSLRAERPDVSEPVHALLERCVQRSPQERFADARALLKALRQIAGEDEDVLQDPDTGQGTARLGVVSPPPRQSLLKIRAAVIGSEPMVRTAEPAEPAVPRAVDPPTVPRPEAQPTARREAAQPRVKGLLPLFLALVLLVVGGGYAYSAGWFGGGAASPGGPPKTEVPEDDKARTPDATGAKAAYDRAMLALPKVDGLDAAIQDLELALKLDPGFEAARGPLVLALRKKAEKLEPQDPDAAYERLVRATGLVPKDTALTAYAGRVRQALIERLRKSIQLSEPTADTLREDRSVRVRGLVHSATLKALRVTLDNRPDAAQLAFPAPGETPVQLVAGEFDLALTVAADGSALLRVEVEDVHGLRAEAMPVAMRFDTTDPEPGITAPKANAWVPARVTFSGRVVDATKVTLTVGGEPVEVQADGTWTRGLTLGHGEQDVPIVAVDEARRRKATSWHVRVDAKDPVLELSAPAATNQDQVTITGTATDDSPVALTVDGKRVVPRQGRHVRDVHPHDRSAHLFRGGGGHGRGRQHECA